MNIIVFMVSAFFVTLLLIKEVSKKKFCVICASVSVTWIILLVFFILGKFHEPIFLGVLMGESMVGLYYFLEKRVAQPWHIFRLPFLLSATVVIFLILKPQSYTWQTVLFIGILWILFGFLFIYRSNKKIKKSVDRIIACCKDW